MTSATHNATSLITTVTRMTMKLIRHETNVYTKQLIYIQLDVLFLQRIRLELFHNFLFQFLFLSSQVRQLLTARKMIMKKFAFTHGSDYFFKENEKKIFGNSKYIAT